ARRHRTLAIAPIAPTAPLLLFDEHHRLSGEARAAQHARNSTPGRVHGARDPEVVEPRDLDAELELAGRGDPAGFGRVGRSLAVDHIVIRAEDETGGILRQHQPATSQLARHNAPRARRTANDEVDTT